MDVTMRAAAATDIRALERIFYTGMAVSFTTLVFAGFARTYYLRSYFAAPELDLVRHAHGIIFSSWLILLLVQTSLVAARRTDLHRKVGVIGLSVAGAMNAVGLVTALTRARIIELPPGSPPPLAFLTVPLGDLVVFTTLFAFAYRWRRRLDFHKRLMMLATIAILPAAVARLPFGFILQGGPLVFFGLADALIVVLAAFDFATTRRIHPATLWGGLLVIVSHPLRLVIGTTPAWLSFADWLVRLIE